MPRSGDRYHAPPPAARDYGSIRRPDTTLARMRIQCGFSPGAHGCSPSRSTVDLGSVLDLFDRTLDNHAPTSLGCGLDAIDLEGGLARQQQRSEFRPACRTEDNRL